MPASTASPPTTAPAPPAGRHPAARRRRAAALLLLLPALVALVLFFVLPLLDIIIGSFTDPEPGLGNYLSLFTDGYTLRVLGRTLLVALIVTLVGLLLGYPYAYMMTLAG